MLQACWQVEDRDGNEVWPTGVFYAAALSAWHTDTLDSLTVEIDSRDQRLINADWDN